MTQSVGEGMAIDVVQGGVDSTLSEITKLMAVHQVSSIVIVEAGRPVGMITEQEIVQSQALELDFDRLSAGAVMIAPLFCLQPEDSLWLTRQVMASKQIRQLVVIDAQGALCGIVTQSNPVKGLDPLEILQVVGSLQTQLMARATELEQANAELRSQLNQKQQLEDRSRRASVSLEELMAGQVAKSAVLTEQVEVMKQDRKSVDLALATSQQGISDFMQNAVLGIHWVDQNGIVIWANRAELEMLGYESSEYIGQVLHDFHVDRVAIRCAFQKLLHDEPVINHESQMIRKDGSICDVSINAAALFRDGKFIHARCFTQDISEQKQAEAELKRGERQIRAQANMLNVATDAIVVRNLVDFTIEFWNSGAERIYGWSAAEVTGLKTTVELFLKDASQVNRAALEAVIQKGTWQGELHKLTKTGREVIVESRCSLVLDAAGNPKSILSVETDITAKKQLEQQFFRVQRLESLGTLASGIAHDLNNILTPILGVAQLLPLTLPTLDDHNQELLTMLVGSAHRGSGLVKQILTFAKGIDGKPMLLQFRHILMEIISIAQQTFPKSIDIYLDLDSEDLWMVHVDATQIHQVLMNLFVNARDAIENAGSITATARNVVLDDSYTKLHPEVLAGAYILITIADTGIGMESETVDRIFDAFFTTKEAGTGLGLSTVMGIVKAHGGFITVETVIGQGTAFNVYIPAIKSPADHLLATIPESFDGNGQLVLIIDDEIAVREITKEALEFYNYRTMVASDGIEALVLYAQHWQRIGIVIVDMFMPHLDTPSVIQALQKINPAIKIIVMSGSTGNQGILEQYGLRAFLTKPFTAIEIMQALAIEPVYLDAPLKSLTSTEA